MRAVDLLMVDPVFITPDTSILEAIPASADIRWTNVRPRAEARKVLAPPMLLP